MHQYLDVGILLPVYNLLIGVGAILGFLHLEKQITSRKINFKIDKNIYFSLIVSIFIGFIGAKAFEILYFGYSFTFYNFINGGITFMGGLLSAGITFCVINVLLGTSNFLAFNLLVPFLLITHFFGRLGCFLAGCCYGKPTDSIFGVVYPIDSLPAQHFKAGTHLHPTQLYEAFFLLILLIVIIRKVKFNFRIPVYLVAYGLFRFMVENYRADERGSLFTTLLSPSQILSIIFFMIGFWSYIKIKKQQVKTESKE